MCFFSAFEYEILTAWDYFAFCRREHYDWFLWEEVPGSFNIRMVFSAFLPTTFFYLHFSNFFSHAIFFSNGKFHKNPKQDVAIVWVLVIELSFCRVVLCSFIRLFSYLSWLVFFMFQDATKLLPAVAETGQRAEAGAMYANAAPGPGHRGLFRSSFGQNGAHLVECKHVSRPIYNLYSSRPLSD